MRGKVLSAHRAAVEVVVVAVLSADVRGEMCRLRAELAVGAPKQALVKIAPVSVEPIYPKHDNVDHLAQLSKEDLFVKIDQI